MLITTSSPRNRIAAQIVVRSRLRNFPVRPAAVPARARMPKPFSVPAPVKFIAESALEQAFFARTGS